MHLRFEFEGLVHLCHRSHLYAGRVYTRCSIALDRVYGSDVPDPVNCLACLVKELRR